MRISILYADWDLLREHADLALKDGKSGTRDTYMAVTMRGEDVLDSQPTAYSIVWEGYRTAHPEALKRMGIDQQVLSELWEQFNIGDHGGQRIRSMSVGDQVWIDDRKWVCKPIGWERCDRNTAKPGIRKMQPDNVSPS